MALTNAGTTSPGTTSPGTADQSLAAQINHHGGVDRVFSSKVRDYLLSRPDYPASLLSGLRSMGALPAGALIADVGAGTGLLSRALLLEGYRVEAIEPNDEMRAAADLALADFAGYRSRKGSAEQTGLRDQSVDLITAAQAFHWFDVSRAKAECLRVLKTAGRVALIWNDRVLSDPINQALDEVMAHYGGQLRKATSAAEERRHVPLFFGDGATTTLDLPHEQTLTRQGLLALVFSRSYMPAQDSLAGAQAQSDILHTFESLAVAGRVTMRYRTVAIVGRPGPGR